MDFTLYNTAAGTIYGGYDARDAGQAADLLAQDMGYNDFAHARAMAMLDPDEMAIREGSGDRVLYWDGAGWTDRKGTAMSAAEWLTTRKARVSLVREHGELWASQQSIEALDQLVRERAASCRCRNK